MGLEKKIAKTEFNIDVGFEFYYYPGGRAPVPRQIGYNTVEFYAVIAYKNFNIQFHNSLMDYFGENSHNPPTNWNKGRVIRPNGDSWGSIYVEANYSFSPWHKWTIALHAGYQAVSNYSQLNYMDWLAEIAYAFDWFELSLSYVQTNAKHAFYDVPNAAYKPKRRNLGGPTVVLGILKSF